MSQQLSALAAAITVMIYTRPFIVEGEGIRLEETQCGPILAHYAIFGEDEALERLASGLWVDHPNKLSTLDAAIAEAAGKEAKREKQESDDEEAAHVKADQDANGNEKAPESTATASEQEAAPKDAEGEKEPENSAGAQESTQVEAAAESQPKDGDKVDGDKVPTDKKVKK